MCFLEEKKAHFCKLAAHLAVDNRTENACVQQVRRFLSNKIDLVNPNFRIFRRMNWIFLKILYVFQWPLWVLTLHLRTQFP